MTPSREAEKDYQGYFNSPPNKKNHIATTMINTVLFKISTHIFTRRMTATCTNTTVSNIISTHILTKRMTSPNSVAVAWGYISTHILTKRMTAILNKNNLFKIAYYINNKHFISIVDIFFHFHIYF